MTNLINKLKSFWKWMDTSHGTHTKYECEYASDGHSSRDPMIAYQSPNKTPLQKTLITLVILGIGFSMRGCYLIEQRTKERRILNRTIALINSRDNKPNQFSSYSSRELSHYTQRTIENIEAGKLNSKSKFWDDYKEIFGDKEWWPKENELKK